jgi:hypothetical protein
MVSRCRSRLEGGVARCCLGQQWLICTCALLWCCWQAPMYYRGAHAAVLVFDVTSADTLDKVGGWAEELSGHANEDMVLVLAANKADLLSASTAAQPPAAGTAASATSSAPSSSSSLPSPPSSSVYPSSLQSSAQQYAASIHAAYFETSAKTGAGIESLFRHVASTLLHAHLDKERREGRGGAGGGDDGRGGAAAAAAAAAGKRKLSLQAREQGEMDSAGCC